MGPPLRHPSRRAPPLRSPSRSPSPDPELIRYLNEQKRPSSPESEAFRNKRIAAGGALNIKSRHQKEKEEVERKKLDEEERAAKAYQEFVRDMEGNDREGIDRKSGFVRAGSSSSYEPATRHQASISASIYQEPDHILSYDRMTGSTISANRESDDNNQDASKKRDVPGKRLGAMGSFLSELQRDQAQREERLRSKVVAEGTSISTLLAQETGVNAKPWASNDQSSSNVCILNLPSNITETIFGNYFARYGDVASVKIMWPRTADDMVAANMRSTKTPGATGFVNFMNRSDAERTHREAEGSEWFGCMLRTSWGKALRKPSFPLHPQSSYTGDSTDGVSKGSASKIDSHTRSSRGPRSKNHRRVREKSPHAITNLQDLVVKSKGEEIVKKIQFVASRVKEYGKTFEDMLRNKERDNPLFSFLQQVDTRENDYYRALLDDQFVIVLPLPPFQDDGNASLYSSDSEEDSEWEKLRSKERMNDLGKAAGRRLQAMLRGITLRRERIARVMLFAIDHAAAAESVSNMIVESLLQPSTPLSRKLARLYTISDVLHNSSVSASNAWRYRSLFEDKLDKVFLHWGDVANSFSGRIKRESCKEMARSIINVWEHWLIYENTKLTTWRQHIESGSATEARVEDIFDGGIV